MNNFKSIIVSILIGLAVAITVMAFKSPTANPPDSAGQVIYADSSGNVGIGTATPTSKLYIQADTAYSGNEATSHGINIGTGIATNDHYLYMGADKTNDLSYIQSIGNQTYKPLVLQGRGGNVGIGMITPGQKLTVAGTIESTLGGFKFPDGTTQSAAAGASVWTTSGNNIYNANSGNVGIGVTGPTVKFEVFCPTGFTNIKAGNNQLGCMQTAEEGTNTFFVALQDCFTTYGGTFPTSGEWYIAMNNYTLTAETDDYEWTNDRVSTTNDSMGIIGSGNITNVAASITSGNYAYRCWLPR